VAVVAQHHNNVTGGCSQANASTVVNAVATLLGRGRLFAPAPKIPLLPAVSDMRTIDRIIDLQAFNQRVAPWFWITQTLE